MIDNIFIHLLLSCHFLNDQFHPNSGSVLGKYVNSFVCHISDQNTDKILILKHNKGVSIKFKQDGKAMSSYSHLQVQLYNTNNILHIHCIHMCIQNFKKVGQF